MKKIALLVGAGLVSASVAAAPGALPTVPQVSNVNITGAVNSYNLPVSDNAALVLMDGGDWADVSIVQGVVPSGDGNRAVVDMEGSGNDNNVTVKQNRYDNRALVQAFDGSHHNDVEIKQNDDSRAWVLASGGSDHNNVEIEQKGSSNQARVAMRDGSDENDVDINQFGNSHIANVGFKSNSDDNEVYILQRAGYKNSLAEVALYNASNNNDGNQFNGTSGIYIDQTSGDYAGVFVSNADHNAIYIKQN
jgi:hypothetical protein